MECNVTIEEKVVDSNFLDDREKLIKLYRDMYAAMIAKNESELERVYDDSFVLEHMTGMRQNRKKYISAILDGTLNYYSEKTDDIEIDISDNTAVMIGRSKVAAAVFGGERHTWRLALRFDAKKVNGEWKFSRARAFTW